MAPFTVLHVCMGNICRSPMAERLLRLRLADRLGPAAADLVTGSFIIETIFNVPGLGREFVTSIARRDYSMIMGTTLFYAILVALANVLVDVSYGALDPRLRTAA